MRTVNRDVEFLEDVRQRAEVIFVTMRQDNGRDVVTILFEKIEIWNTDIDAVSSFFGESHARVEDDHLILITHRHTIHPKLADTAERNDLQDITHREPLLNSQELLILMLTIKK